MSDKLVDFVRKLDWEKQSQDPECFYAMSEGGVWFPDTLHKPFLRAAVQELRGMQREYARLMSYFSPQENDGAT